MVICKVQLTANSESPIPEIERESSWIPEAAKGKKRTDADFAPRKKRDFAPQAPESQQTRGRGENRLLIELPDRIGGSGHRFWCPGHPDPLRRRLPDSRPAGWAVQPDDRQCH